MRSIPVWAALAQLLLLALAIQLGANASATTGGDNAWQRSLFGRNSRNLLHRSASGSTGAVPVPGPVPLTGLVPDPNAVVADVGGPFDLIASNLHNVGYNNEYGQVFPQFGAAEQQQQPQQQQQQLPSLPSSLRQPQTEVYGIVEPLIEDTPCANRACLVNEDCCPTGVCVNTYGDGKCVYVFGRQRDLCQGHADCEAGTACMLVPQEGIWRCETEAPMLTDAFSVRPKHPLGSECSSSSDCQVFNGMCCQHQRLHHRAVSKLTCGYFRDAFDCVDVTQEHMARVFQQRHN